MSKYSDPITATGSLISLDAPFGGVFDSLSVPIMPAQDLNGYSSPWPAGGGKNKLPAETMAQKYSNTIVGTIDANAGDYTFSFTGDLEATWQVTARKIVGDTKTQIKAVHNVYSISFTLDEDAILEIEIYRTNIQLSALSKFQLEHGSTATAYSPYSNICPISGRTGVSVYRTGKNLLDPAYKTTSVSNVRFYYNVGVKLKAGTYTLSCPETVSGIYVNEIGSSTLFTKYNATFLTFTLTEEKTVHFDFYKSNINQSMNCQLELGSTATAYEPYSGNTYSVDWTTQAGTVYHGMVDPVTGQLTVDRASVLFDGTQTVGLANWMPNSSSVGWLYNPSVTPGILNQEIFADTIESSGFISDTLKTVKYGGGTGVYGGTSPCISLVGTAYWGVAMRLNDTTLTTATKINEYLSANPIRVVYKLATPLTYRLTPKSIEALTGSNNIWVDTSAVITLIYRLLQVDRQTDRTSIGKRAESLNVLGKFSSISKVEVNVTENLFYEAGDSSGRTLTVDCPFGTQAMANNLLAMLQGYVYQPFEARRSIANPATELGDGVTVGDVYGGIYAIYHKCGPLHLADLSAPADEEIDHEYKFTPAAERKIERRLNNMESELSVQAGEISAKVDRQGGDPSSVSWLMDSDVFKVAVDGNDVLTVDENGLTVNGDGNFTGNVHAGNIQYGGSAGTMSGNGITSRSIGTGRLTSGINTSLGNADYSADVFSGAVTANYLKGRRVEVMGGQSFFVYGKQVVWSTINYKNHAGVNSTVKALIQGGVNP